MQQNIGTLRLKIKPHKGERAWQIVPDLLSDVPIWIPFSVINSYDENTLVIKLETWWLIKNNIPFKL